MNWVIINGSPRKNGNTNFVCEQLKNILSDKNDHVFIFPVYARKVHPCIDCRGCKRDNLDCIVTDDMQELYKEMENADIIVFASPIYWSGVTGPMKNIVDRMRPYYQNRKLKGKKAWVVSIGASADSESDLIEAMYERVSNALGMKMLKTTRITGFDEDDVRKSGYRMEDELANREVSTD